MSSTTQPEIRDLKKEVQTLVNTKCKGRGFRLYVNSHRKDDDWIIIAVGPKRPGIAAYDYAQVLSDAEKELRERGYEHVILVPVLTD
jgi:hypothetical protein